MADVQLENGYTKIANELLEALYSTNFSEYEHRIIKFIIRLSYGCNKKTALIRHWNDLCIAGIPSNKIKSTINRLKENNIVTVDNDILELSLNKDYDTWGIKRCSGYNGEKWIDILKYNLKMSGQTKSQSELTKSTPKYNNSQYEKYTVFDEKSIQKLTKSQVGVDEKSTPIADNSNIDNELEQPKEILKKDKESEKTIFRRKLMDFKCELGRTLNLYWKEKNLREPYHDTSEISEYIKEIGKLSNYDFEIIGPHAHEALNKRLLDDAVYEHIIAGLRGAK